MKLSNKFEYLSGKIILLKEPKEISSFSFINFTVVWLIVKAMVFPVGMYGCKSWTINKAEHQRTVAFKLWCWRRLFRVPWTIKRSNQSILKEINPEYSLEGLMLKLQYLVIWCNELTHWKRPWWWERWKAKGEEDSRGWDG